MRLRMRTAATLALLVLAATACSKATQSGTSSGGGSTGGGAKHVTVRLGIEDFGAEPEILGAIYTQALQKAGYTVQLVKTKSREVAAPAFASGQMDVLLEYAGSDLTFLTKKTLTDEAQVLSALKSYYASKNVTVLDPAPMSDQQGVAATKATAGKYSLKTLSDLGKVTTPLTFAGPPECKDRLTCFKGLQQTYGFQHVKFQAVGTPGLRYQALQSGQIQVSLVFTTDGQIAKLGLALLDDNKKLFPPDHLVPLVKSDFLSKAGGDFTSTMNKVSAQITTADITALNAKVDIDKQDPDTVGKDYAQQKGLI